MINNISNNTKENIQYELFLNSVLFRIGIGYANKGTYYFKELIKMIYLEDIPMESFKDLCNMLAERLNKQDPVSLKRNINSTVRRIDVDKAKYTFYDIFNIEFDDYFLTPKHLTILIVNTLNRLYKN